jgi:hypothetical protein
MKFLISAVLALSVLAGSAHSMEFGFKSTPSAGFVQMTGEIEKGDDLRFKEFLGTLPPTLGKGIFLVLDSTGGSFVGAMDLADVLQTATVVVKDNCQSACFILFAAAKGKIVYPSAKIGVHMGFSKDPEKVYRAVADTVTVAVALRELSHVPDDILMDMLSTPSDKMHWLTKDQLTRMDATIISKEKTVSSK